VMSPLSRLACPLPRAQAYFNDTRRHLYGLDSSGQAVMDVSGTDEFLVTTRDWYQQTWDGWSPVRDYSNGRRKE